MAKGAPGPGPAAGRAGDGDARDGPGPRTRPRRPRLAVDAERERQDRLGGPFPRTVRGDESGVGKLEKGQSHPPRDGTALPPRNLLEPPRRPPFPPPPRRNPRPYLISINYRTLMVIWGSGLAAAAPHNSNATVPTTPAPTASPVNAASSSLCF